MEIKFLNKIKNGIQVFSVFWKILDRKRRIHFFLLVFAMAFGSFLETLTVSIFLPYIQAVLSPEDFMKNAFVKKIIDFLGITKPTSVVILVSVAVVLSYLLKNIYLFFSEHWQQKFRVNLQGYVSVTLLRSYMHRPYAFFIEMNSSVLMRNVINYANSIMGAIFSMFGIFSQAFLMLFIFAFLFITDSFTAGILFSLTIVLIIIPLLILNRPLRRYGEELTNCDGYCYKYCQQAFQGVKEIKVSCKEDFFADLYKKTYEAKNVADVKKCDLSYIPSRIIETVCMSVIILILVLNYIIGNGMSYTTLSKLGAFGVAALKLLPSISTISSSFNSFLVTSVILYSVHQNLEESKKHLPLQRIEEISFNDSIRMENVAFTYSNNKEKKILDDVSLEIKKGDVIGIKGTSGSGKTTLVDVLLGLLLPENGSILIDGVPLTDKNMISWREKFSYVPQTAYLIDDTITKNVAFGFEDNTINLEKVNDVIDESMLREYVDSLPKKENTVVGERGIAMSGGQRQRLSIARALYSDPEIIVFDEATSALDENTEKDIMQSIDKLAGQKTLIIIAHRLSTLKKCNKIFEVKDGKVIINENK